MFTKILKWNTGRGYSADGQLIEAIFVPTRIDDNGDQVGAIEFVDVTRGIDGRFNDVRFTNREIPDNVFKTIVLSRYDDGGYDSTQIIKLDFNKSGYTVGYHAGAAEALAEFDDSKPAPVEVPADGHTFTGGLYATGPTDAIDEAIIGDHVAHVRNPDNDRVVAIRVGGVGYPSPDFRREFELTFSDPKVDLRNFGDTVVFETVKEADKAIRNFLVGTRCASDQDYYQDFVNQKTRDCEIVKLTPTRARVEYWLPNSGQVGAWRAYTRVGYYLYLRGV